MHVFCSTGQMHAVETGQMSAAETGQMSSAADIRLVSIHNVEVSEVSTVPISQCSSLRKSVRPQIIKNGSKWVQNGRQDLRIGPRACHGHFLASGTGPAAKNPPKYRPNSRSTAPRRPLLVLILHLTGHFSLHRFFQCDREQKTVSLFVFLAISSFDGR